MNLLANIERTLKTSGFKINVGRITLLVAATLILELLIIFKGSLFANSAPFLAVGLSWIWFLLPGLLLSYILVDRTSFWERIPISFVLTIGISTPITIFAILQRIDLDVFTFLHTIILVLSASLLMIFRWRVKQNQSGISSVFQKPSLSEYKLSDIILVGIFIILIGVFIFLAQAWPLFGDEVAGLSIFSEVISKGRITGSEPFHGSGIPVTPRNELIVWTYLAILTNDISGASPANFFINSRPILVVMALLSLGTLINQLFKDNRKTLFLLCLWSIYLLATTQADGTGNNLITRIIQDKFVGWFVVIPIVLVFVLRFVENRNKTMLMGFAIVTFGASMVHPITLTQTTILVGAFGFFHFLFERTRKTFIVLSIVAFVLLLSTVIPFYQYLRYINYSPVEVAGLGDAVEFGRLSSAVGRYRLWLLGEGRFILHPTVILKPVIIAASVLLPLIILKMRKHYAARLIAGTFLILPALLYIPTFAALAGRVVTPFLLWRLAWPLPLFSVLIIGWVLWTLVDKLEGGLKIAEKQTQLKSLFLSVIIILALLFAAPNIKTGLLDYRSRMAEINLSNCITANRALRFLDDISKDDSINVFSTHKLNFCIPGFAAFANVVEFRGLGTVNRLSEENIPESLQRVEDVSHLDVANLFDDRLMQAVIRHNVDYILLEKEKLDLNFQLKSLPSLFNIPYEDEDYIIYEVQKPVQEVKIVEANKALRLHQYEDAIEQFNGILREEPGNVLAFLGIGLSQEGMGEIEQAILNYKKALKLAPNEPALHAQLGSAYALLEDFESAITEYQVATNISPNRYTLYADLGRIFILADQRQKARSNFEKVASLRAVDGTAKYYSIVGRLYQSANLMNEAIQYYKKAISIKPDVNQYIELGRALSISGRKDEAIEIYKTAIELDRWDYLPHLDLGNIYKKQDRVDDAIREFEIASQLKPTNVSSYILLGQTIQEKSGSEKAKQRLEELKNVSRVLPGPYRGLATLMVVSGKFEDARQSLDSSANMQPNSAAILTAKGYISMADRDFNQAYKEFNQALEINPDLVSARLGLSLLYKFESRSNLEAGQLIRIIKLIPSAAWPHLNLAQIYKQQGNWNAALEEIDWALKLEPGNVEGYFAKCDLYRMQYDLNRAISYCSQALEMDPENVNILMTLGDIYQNLAKPDEAESVYKLADKLSEDSPYPKLKLADIYWQQGRFEEATALEESSFELAPDSDFVLIKLAESYKTQGKIEEARELYQRVISMEPDVVVAYSALAQLLAEEDNDPTILFSLYSDMLYANPESAEAYLEAGQFFLEQGQLDLAEQIFQNALSYPGVSIDNYLSISDLQQQRGQWSSALETLQTLSNLFPSNAIVFDSLGEFHLKIGEYKKAELYFERAIELNPLNISAYVGKSQIEQINGDINQAEQTLEHAIAKNPEIQNSLLAMASFQESIGRIDEAEKYLNEAAELAPFDIKVQQSLGQFHMRQNRYDKALEIFHNTLMLPGSKLEIYLDIGDLHFTENRLEEAIDWYRDANSLNRSDVRPYLALADLYQSRDQWDEALEMLNTAINIAPANVDVHLALGDFYQRVNRIENAISHFSRAAEFNQSQTLSLIRLAEISKDQGNLEQAIKYLEKAIEISPTSYSGYAVLAQIYHLSEEYDRAIATITQGIRNSIDKQDAYINRAKLYENLGMWDLAHADYEKAINIYPHSKLVGLKLVDFLSRRNDLNEALAVLSQLEHRVGLDAEISTEYGNIFFLQADWDKAIAAYKQAISLDETAKDGYIGLARIYKSQGAVDKAIELYQTALKNISNDKDLLIGLGKGLQSQGKYDEAYAVFQNAQRSDPSAIINLISIEHLNWQNDYTEADLSALVQNALEAPTSDAFNTIAHLYQIRGDMHLALSWFRKSVSLEPYNDENWYFLGNHYRVMADWEKALEAYNQAIKFNPTAPDTLLAMGKIQEELGFFESALDSYQRSIEINPSTIDGYIALSRLQYQIGDIEKSLETISDGIVNVPADYRGYQTLGDIYMDLNADDISQASAVYQQGLKVLPGAAILYARIGDLYTNRVLEVRERLDAANGLENLAEYRLELLLEREDTASNRQQKRATELRIEQAQQNYIKYRNKLLAAERDFSDTGPDREKAENYYLRALKIEPVNEFALLGFGKLLIASGSVDEAVNHFEQAVKSNPDSSLLLSYLGNIYLEINQPDKAVDVFERILALEPGNLIAHLGSSNAYENIQKDNVSQAATSVEKNLIEFQSIIDYYRRIEIRENATN